MENLTKTFITFKKKTQFVYYWRNKHNQIILIYESNYLCLVTKLHFSKFLQFNISSGIFCNNNSQL